MGRRIFVIGDTLKDMELANAVNVPGYLFSGGNLLEFVRHVLVLHGCN